MPRYVVLLRGINVGGKNVIPMRDLAACFAGAGYADVATYIQSGNVLLTSPARGPALTTAIERLLATTFAYDATVVVRSASQLRAVIAAAPDGFGSQPDAYRYDCLFLRAPLTAAAALRQIPVKPGVDTADAGPGVVYASRLIARATQSHISRLNQAPGYALMTIRNWNTTTKLAALL